jgi:hypothetical protein
MHHHVAVEKPVAGAFRSPSHVEGVSRIDPFGDSLSALGFGITEKGCGITDAVYSE